jgi:hypothetical protein
MTTATNLDFWDVAIAPNVPALPPVVYGGDPIPTNSFIATGTLYMIVGDHVIDPKYYDQTHQDPALYCEDLYQLFNVQCVAMSQHFFDTMSPLWPKSKFVMIEERVARNGRQFFADYRSAAKVWMINTDPAASANLPDAMKIPVEITDDIIADVVQFMYLFAKEIVEDEYERRFLAYAPAGLVEQATWEIQKHEAREWLRYQGADGHVTPFLDYMASEHNRDKTELANKILTKAEAYEDGLSTMLVNLQKVLKDFQSATTVWDMNIKYEQYFGLQMPIKQAQALGLTEGPDSTTRITEVPHGFKF